MLQTNFITPQQFKAHTSLEAYKICVWMGQGCLYLESGRKIRDNWTSKCTVVLHVKNDTATRRVYIICICARAYTSEYSSYMITAMKKQNHNYYVILNDLVKLLSVSLRNQVKCVVPTVIVWQVWVRHVHTLLQLYSTWKQLLGYKANKLAQNASASGLSEERRIPTCQKH